MSQVFKDGIWQEGKAAPEDKGDLAQYPSEFVTKEIADEKRIHPDDPEHIRLALLDDLVKPPEGAPKQAKETLKKYSCAPLGVPCKVSQWEIDVVRMRVLYATINSALMHVNKGLPFDLKPKHLWFPKDEIQIYELRHGNPPSDSDRPKHLRGMELVVNLFDPPRRLLELLKEQGTPLELPTEAQWDILKSKCAENAQKEALFQQDLENEGPDAI